MEGTTTDLQNTIPTTHSDSFKSKRRLTILQAKTRDLSHYLDQTTQDYKNMDSTGLETTGLLLSIWWPQSRTLMNTTSLDYHSWEVISVDSMVMQPLNCVQDGIKLEPCSPSLEITNKTLPSLKSLSDSMKPIKVISLSLI